MGIGLQGVFIADLTIHDLGCSLSHLLVLFFAVFRVALAGQAVLLLVLLTFVFFCVFLLFFVYFLESSLVQIVVELVNEVFLLFVAL